MIAPGAGVRVYLACGRTDMRKGLDGLAMLVQRVWQCQEFRVWAAVEHQAAKALTKRSPKMTAN